jgi:hypothetical protein
LVSFISLSEEGVLAAIKTENEIGHTFGTATQRR